MIPERYAPMTYAFFRIVFGFLFLCFGLQKMFGLFGGQVPPLASLQGAAGVVETVCGLLVMLGLFTRLAAFLASGEMAVAFWYIHVSVVAMGKGLGMPLASSHLTTVVWTRWRSVSHSSTLRREAQGSGASMRMMKRPR